MEKNNPYRLLGLKDGVDRDSIKKRYRAIAFRFHPDRAPTEKNARRIFESATEAYKFLSDIEKKRKFDTVTRNPVKKFKFGKTEYIGAKRNNREAYYSRKTISDIEYNQFVDECRNNFIRFLQSVEKIKK